MRRWLVEQLNVNIADPAAMKTLDTGAAETWFCPITDSMRINSFLKVNKLTGQDYRPDWWSLSELGDFERISRYITSNHIQRIVLLEDFVGSGTQMQDAVRFAAAISSNIEILVLPLVICPAGDQIGHELEEKIANISYEPVIMIPSEMFIKADAQPDEPLFFQTVRDLIIRVRTRLSKPAIDAESQRYHGYKGTGAVIAMYSNCPR